MRLKAGWREIKLDSQSRTGYGWEVLSGVTGVGLPPVQTQYNDAAGNGARYRGRRVLPRDIDLKLNLNTRNTAELQSHLDNMSLLLNDKCQLIWTEDDGEEWFLDVVRTGGGDYVYGVDTNGLRSLENFVITLRAGDPFWTAMKADSVRVTQSGTKRPFLKNMVKLSVSPSQQIGSVTVENLGTAEAYPTWYVRGPGRNIQIRLPDGRGFEWQYDLEDWQSLTINTHTGTVIDGQGFNRYASLAPGPKLFSLPPGKTTITASMTDTGPTSFISCSWQKRKWALI
jgi:hypothetical protein